MGLWNTECVRLVVVICELPVHYSRARGPECATDALDLNICCDDVSFKFLLLRGHECTIMRVEAYQSVVMRECHRR